jgi:hypothetical protein
MFSHRGRDAIYGNEIRMQCEARNTFEISRMNCENIKRLLKDFSSIIDQDHLARFLFS